MKKRNAGIVVTSIFLALFLALEVFLCVWFFGADYSEFDALTTAEEEIPGLGDGISPQGLCPVSAEGYTCAMSGYLKEGPSRVYLIGKTSKYVTLKREGKDVDSHFGGIACDGETLFVASGKQLLSIPLAAAAAAENGAALDAEVALTVSDFRSIAFCCFADGFLYAGEFYRPGNYETDPSHHLEANGETNYGFVYAYRKEETGYVRCFTLSVCAQVQGMTVNADGTVVLSTSYGLPDSRILIYRSNELKECIGGNYESDPVIRLDGKNLVKEWKTPCMSEELFERDGKLYLLYESDSAKYRLFVRRRIDRILSVSLSDLL